MGIFSYKTYTKEKPIWKAAPIFLWHFGCAPLHKALHPAYLSLPRSLKTRHTPGNYNGRSARDTCAAYSATEKDGSSRKEKRKMNHRAPDYIHKSHERACTIRDAALGRRWAHEHTYINIRMCTCVSYGWLCAAFFHKSASASTFSPFSRIRMDFGVSSRPQINFFPSELYWWVILAQPTRVYRCVCVLIAIFWWNQNKGAAPWTRIKSGGNGKCADLGQRKGGNFRAERVVIDGKRSCLGCDAESLLSGHESRFDARSR